MPPSSALSTATPTATAAPSSIAIKGGLNIAVVSERGFYAPIIDYAGHGNLEATVLDAYREGEYVWLFVQFEYGRRGWMFTRYSEDNSEVSFNKSAMNMIAAADTHPTSTPIPTWLDQEPSIFPPLPPPECLPTDQDQYVYQPARLPVYTACIHVSGVVRKSGSNERDGDTVLDVALDAPYQRLINNASRLFRDGHMHVEIICSVPMPPGGGDFPAVQACAKNPDPLSGPFPRIGDHVWLEGRLVLDSYHDNWVELHPLYRWGPVK